MIYQDEFTDSKEFRGLTRDSKLLSIYLLMGKVSLCGVCEMDDELIEFSLKMNAEEISSAIKELEQKSIIAFDKSTREIVFPNFIKGENPLKFRRAKMVKFKNDLLRVKSKAIKEGIERNYDKLVYAAKMSEGAANQSKSPLQNLNG